VKRRTRYASDYAGEVLVGPRGGSYYVDKDGVKVYLVSKKKPNRYYNPPTGSFSRYLQNQI
jgi:ribosomal protein L24E